MGTFTTQGLIAFGITLAVGVGGSLGAIALGQVHFGELILATTSGLMSGLFINSRRLQS